MDHEQGRSRRRPACDPGPGSQCISQRWQRAWQYAGEFKKDKPAVVGGLRVDISVADADCLAQAPGIIPEEELSMADAGDILSFLQEMKQEMVVFGTTGLEKTVEDFATRQRQALAKLDQLDARLTKIEQHLNIQP